MKYIKALLFRSAPILILYGLWPVVLGIGFILAGVNSMAATLLIMNFGFVFPLTILIPTMVIAICFSPYTIKRNMHMLSLAMINVVTALFFAYVFFFEDIIMKFVLILVLFSVVNGLIWFFYERKLSQI